MKVFRKVRDAQSGEDDDADLTVSTIALGSGRGHVHNAGSEEGEDFNS